MKSPFQKSKPLKLPRLLSPLSLAAASAAAALCLGAATPAATQYADLDRADWQEDAAPPPPSYSLNGLIDIEMPRASTVRMGLDPDTVTLNAETGIVRYVVVARGPSATNAFYEGIRCATGEYRVYARQVRGSEWAPASDSEWKSMRGQVSYPHPYRLARDGICLGTTPNATPKEMVRALRSPKGTLYD